MTTQNEQLLNSLKTMNARFRELTGRDAFLYATQPDRATYYHFATGGPACTRGTAERYMRGLLERAESDPEGGWRWW